MWREENPSSTQKRNFCQAALHDGLVETSTQFWKLFKSIQDFRGIPVLVTPWEVPGEYVGRSISSGIVLDTAVHNAFPYGTAWAVLLHEWGHAQKDLPASKISEREANRQALMLIEREYANRPWADEARAVLNAHNASL